MSSTHSDAGVALDVTIKGELDFQPGSEAELQAMVMRHARIVRDLYVRRERVRNYDRALALTQSPQGGHGIFERSRAVMALEAKGPLPLVKCQVLQAYDDCLLVRSSYAAIDFDNVGRTFQNLQL
jgi:hypothetical protein